MSALRLGRTTPGSVSSAATTHPHRSVIEPLERVEGYVLEPDLAPGDHLAVVCARDDDLPQLLGGALVDRFGDDPDSAALVRAEKVRDVVDADRVLAAIQYRRRSADGGRALDRGCIGAAMDDAPRRVLIRTELDPRDHAVRTNRLERQPEGFQECARIIEAGELRGQAFFAGTKRLTNSSALSATSRQPLSMVSAWPRPGISAISVTPSLCF